MNICPCCQIFRGKVSNKQVTKGYRLSHNIPNSHSSQGLRRGCCTRESHPTRKSLQLLPHFARPRPATRGDLQDPSVVGVS